MMNFIGSGGGGGGELNGWAHKDTAVREDAKMLTVKVYKAIGR